MIGRDDSRASQGISRTRVLLTGSSTFETPAERALDRVFRSGAPASVLRLYISRVHAANLRPYHGRVARCLFDDTVQVAGGQVFACKNGDLVLIAGPEPVATLASVLLRLFRAEAPANQQLLGLWSLPEDEARVRAEFAASTEAVLPAEEAPAPLGAIAAVGSLLASAQYGEFVRRQTAVRIVGNRVMTLFDELSISLDAIESRIGLRMPPGADPYLSRYTAGQLDAHLIASLARADMRGTPALHVNMPLAAVGTPRFAAMREAARRDKTLLGVEIALSEAMADIGLFHETRAQLRHDGCTVVLDGVTHHALLQCDPVNLQPDILKLEWSPLLPALPIGDQRRLHRTLEALGTERVVLCRAETEQALVWGLGQGLRCFQGRHVDLMLAADRIRGCEHSAACTLRQCIDRAATSDEAGRQGCLNPSLLGTLPQWRPSASRAVAAV